jgi:RNA polymerase sigma-70 factor (ECF subfamily)
MQLKEERLRSLLIRGLVGDAAAYHIFLGELTAHLRSFVRRRLASLPEEVEDLVQELLLAIHNQRHTYDLAQPLTAWVQAIARYKLIDLLRRRSRTNGLHDPLDEDYDFSRPRMATLLRRDMTCRNCCSSCRIDSGCRSCT